MHDYSRPLVTIRPTRRSMLKYSSKSTPCSKLHHTRLCRTHGAPTRGPSRSPLEKTHISMLPRTYLHFLCIFVRRDWYCSGSTQSASTKTQIYQQTQEVVVWLYEPPFTLFNISATWDIVENDKDRRLTNLPLWSLKMFRHPWFLRVWVLQEVVHAHYITILFQLDDQSIGYRPWDEVLDLGVDYRGRYKDDDRNTDVEENAEVSMAMTVMDDWRGKVESNIFNSFPYDFLSSTRFCGTNDPKDRVFALLVLASDVDLNTFDIDYEMSWVDISVSLARHTVSQSNTLNILRWIEISRITPQVDRLPSMVPDLSSPALLTPSFPMTRPI